MGYAALDLAGKTAVVIGGTSGIGLTLAKGLAEAGADVIPTGRRSELVRAAADSVKARGRRTLACSCDVSQRASVQDFHDRVCTEFAQIDILLNCAGITKRQPTLQISDSEWNNVLEVNLTGTLRACQIFGRDMVKRGYGRIINIGSLSSFLGLHQVAAYGASKAAVASLTKSLAVEWATSGVCINAIVPGVFRTEMNAALLDGTPRGQEFLMRTPMRRFGEMKELVGAAVFLASDASRFVTGQLLVVDGGILASGVNQ